MKKDSPLSKTVTYRTSEAVWERACRKAEREGKTVNDWCRDLMVQSLDDDHGLNPGTQVLLAEIYNLRQLFEKTFDLQTQGKLNEDSYMEILLDSALDREEVLRKYFNRQRIFEINSEDINSGEPSVEDAISLAQANDESAVPLNESIMEMPPITHENLQ